jgi:hypothetical protein
MNTVIVELASFKVVDGTSDSDVRDAVLVLDGYLATRPGYIDRELHHDPATGDWIEQMRWESVEAAESAREPFFSSPHAQPLIAIIDQESAKMTLLESVIARGE